MSNYVWNKVVCSKDFLDTYFIDPIPFGPAEPPEKLYISFNKLFGVQSVDEYQNKIGVAISYGFGFSWTTPSDGLYEVKFCTRTEYPIRAILKALELSHDVQWFAIEENQIYVSKFYWNNGVKEDVASLGDPYYAWNDLHRDLENSLMDCDDTAWYYLQTVEQTWKNWESMDGFQRYQDVAAYGIIPPF